MSLYVLLDLVKVMIGSLVSKTTATALVADPQLGAFGSPVEDCVGCAPCLWSALAGTPGPDAPPLSSDSWSLPVGGAPTLATPKTLSKKCDSNRKQDAAQQQQQQQQQKKKPPRSRGLLTRGSNCAD